MELRCRIGLVYVPGALPCFEGLGSLATDVVQEDGLVHVLLDENQTIIQSIIKSLDIESIERFLDLNKLAEIAMPHEKISVDYRTFFEEVQKNTISLMYLKVGLGQVDYRF